MNLELLLLPQEKIAFKGSSTEFSSERRGSNLRSGTLKNTNLVFRNTTSIGHAERPSEKKNATQGNLGRILIPPWRYVRFVSYEKRPFPMVFDVEVIIYGDPLVFAWMRFGHVIDKGLVLLGREMIAREEVEHNLNLNHGVSWRWFD